MQADAGAQVLKIFESWAEGLPDDLFETPGHASRIRRWSRRVARAGRHRAPDRLPARLGGAGRALCRPRSTVQAVALDTACPLEVGKRVQAIKPIQGALDPLLLRAGGPALDRRVDQLLEAWGQGPWIFNLGHGILPDMPIAHVEQVLKRIGAQ